MVYQATGVLYSSGHRLAVSKVFAAQPRQVRARRYRTGRHHVPPCSCEIYNNAHPHTHKPSFLDLGHASGAQQSRTLMHMSTYDTDF